MMNSYNVDLKFKIFSVDIIDRLSATNIGLFENRTIWQLDKHLRFLINKKYLLIIQPGFQTDLASVPRVPIIYSLWGDRSHREAVLHDYLYRINPILVLSKKQSDLVFKLAMISQKQPYWIYQPMYLGVKFGGGSSYHKLPVDHKFII